MWLAGLGKVQVAVTLVVLVALVALLALLWGSLKRAGRGVDAGDEVRGGDDDQPKPVGA